MTTEGTKRVLFGGYAPVHFLCFLPVYRRLLSDPGVEVFLTGGFREGKGDSATYSLDGFYDAFDVPQGRVIPLEQARETPFDVFVCSHLSDAMFPREVGKSVQLFHGVSFKNLAVREKALRYDFLCLPGRYHAERYQEQGLVRQGGARCLLTGFSKMDALVSGELDRTALLERLELDPARPTILFAPTGEKHNALETMGVDVIWRITKERKWNLLLKPHDHPKKKIDWFSELSTLEGDGLRLVRDPDVVPYLHAADLLMTDASSVAIEYTLLDRPIIFLDCPKMFKKVQDRAPSLDLETYGRKIGRVVKKGSKVAAAIEESLAEVDAPQLGAALRRQCAEHVFHAPGTATERVTEVVRHAAGLRDDLPGDIEVVAPGPPPGVASPA